MTADEILVCDTCGRPIGDLVGGMVFFDDRPVAPGVNRLTISRFRLAHKGRCDTPELDLSLELYWLADREAALFRLADMTTSYIWPAEHLTRMIRIAWAVSVVASTEERRRARKVLEVLC